ACRYAALAPERAGHNSRLVDSQRKSKVSACSALEHHSPLVRSVRQGSSHQLASFWPPSFIIIRDVAYRLPRAAKAGVSGVYVADTAKSQGRGHKRLDNSRFAMSVGIWDQRPTPEVCKVRRHIWRFKQGPAFNSYLN